MEMVLNNSLSQLAGELQLDRVPEIWLKNWDSAISHYNEAGMDFLMDYELCKEAYSMTMEFYPRYLPELQFKGFTCTSWLLNPILRSMLSEDSNIIRFQKDYYLFPVQYDESVFEYVFGNKPDDLWDLPDVTHLQRSIKNYLLKAGNFSSCGGIILKESLMGENR